MPLLYVNQFIFQLVVSHVGTVVDPIALNREDALTRGRPSMVIQIPKIDFHYFVKYLINYFTACFGFDTICTITQDPQKLHFISVSSSQIS